MELETREGEGKVYSGHMLVHTGNFLNIDEALGAGAVFGVSSPGRGNGDQHKPQVLLSEVPFSVFHSQCEGGITILMTPIVSP